MPRLEPKKVHYEDEPGKPLCSAHNITRVTNIPKTVTCGVCRKTLKAKGLIK